MQKKKPQDFIPLTKPYLNGKEIGYLSRAISSLELVGGGPNTRRVEAQIAKIQWMKRNGASIRAICKEVKVSPNTVYAVN